MRPMERLEVVWAGTDTPGTEATAAGRIAKTRTGRAIFLTACSPKSSNA